MASHTSTQTPKTPTRRTRSPSRFNQGIWSQHEHDLFLEALRVFPHGPWKRIAAFVGTRSVRQVQTHTQKYNEKVLRRLRSGPKERKTCVRVEHRIDDDVLSFCTKLTSDNNRSHRTTTVASAAAGVHSAAANAKSAPADVTLTRRSSLHVHAHRDEIDRVASLTLSTKRSDNRNGDSSDGDSYERGHEEVSATTSTPADATDTSSQSQDAQLDAFVGEHKLVDLSWRFVLEGVARDDSRVVELDLVSLDDVAPNTEHEVLSLSDSLDYLITTLLTAE